MASHTATGEWKSFEVRMRRRRAERLAVRAEAAVDAGFFDDARAAIHEARRLAPDLPNLTQIEHAIESRQQARAAEWIFQTRDVSLYAAIALVLLAAIVGYAWTAHRAALAERAENAGAPVAQSNQAPAPIAAPLAPRVVVEQQPITVPETLLTVSSPAPAPPRRPPSADVEAERLPQPSPIESRPQIDVTPLVQHAAETPAPSLPVVTSLPAADVATSSGAAAPTPIVAVPVSSPPVTTAAVTKSTPGDDELVHRTLERYATAYSRLDAEAAQQVWPSVNREALERAFDELSRQVVSLGNCNIQVEGEAARAACAGTETWAPKIGDRQPRTQARNWTFELTKGGAGWQIVSARVQNK